MKRIWRKPVLIPHEVVRHREHMELFVTHNNCDTPLALIAPEVPVLADEGRINLEWLIGNTTSDDKRLRRIVMKALKEHLLERDDPSPWTSLVYKCYRSEVLYECSNETIKWLIEHDLPTAPQRPDWMFGDIPDEELVACCLWEYGRESHTFAMSAADYWINTRHLMEEDPKQKDWHDKKQAHIKEWLIETKSIIDDFSDRFWSSDHSMIEIFDYLRRFGGTSAEAWQKLPHEIRKILVKKVGESITLHPLSLLSVGELEELWNANNKELLEIRREQRDANDDSEDCQMFFDSIPVEIRWNEDDDKPSERTSAAFAIDFSRFTDREILSSFQEWLKRTRPVHWLRPRRVFPNSPQRGRKLIDYQVALERLGLMRLLNDNYPDDLRRDYPEVWKNLCRDETHFRRECRLACDFFRGLFPFLPDGELPRSSKPIEIWEPEIEAELAREEADGTLPTGE